MWQGVIISTLMILAMTGTLRAAEDNALEGREDVTTAKERLVNKAADPQRVNDCKVPSEKRDAERRRPSACLYLERAGENEAKGEGG